MKETILQNANRRKLSLKNKLLKTQDANGKERILSLYYGAYLNFIEAFTNLVWTLSLLKTSVQVTRTPLTTIRSLLKITLPRKSETNESEDSVLIYRGKLAIPIEISLSWMSL